MEDFKYVDQETVRAVAQELINSPDLVDQGIARYLNKSLDVRTGELRKSYVAQSAIEQLGLSLLQVGVSEPEKRGGISGGSMPERLARDFFARVFRELRKILCGPKKERDKLGKHSHAAVAAFVTYLMTILHLSSGTASGIAVLACSLSVELQRKRSVI